MRGLIVVSFVVGCSASQPPCDRTVAGTICTIAGTPKQPGRDGDGGQALDGQLSVPWDTITATDGTIYIADIDNQVVRRISPDGELSSLPDIVGLPSDLMLTTDQAQLYVAAANDHAVVVIDLSTGAITTVAGVIRGTAYTGDGGPATSATMLPVSIARAPSGELAIMDQLDEVIRTVDSAGIIHRFAGSCLVDPEACTGGVVPALCPAPSDRMSCVPADCEYDLCRALYGGDGLPALDALIAPGINRQGDVPDGHILYDAAGDLYFADTGNSMVRMIDTQGIVHAVAGIPPVAGVVQLGYSGDGGPAIDAELGLPCDLALADDGTLYIADSAESCVRAIDPTGTIRTVAGICGSPGFSGDGGPATAATLFGPSGIEWVAPNTLHIADSNNQVVRAVTLP